MRRIGAVLLTGAVPLFFWAAAPAGATDDLVIPVDSVVRGDPGDVIGVADLPVEADLVGASCDIDLVWENNSSTHPDTDLIVTTDGVVTTIADVETTPEGVVASGATVIIGETVKVEIRLGAHGVSSGGLTMNFACVKDVTATTVAPTTTTIAPTTTTLAPTTTEAPSTTTEVPVVVLEQTLEPTAVEAAVVAQPTYTG